METNQFIKNDIATFLRDADTLRHLIRYQNCPRLINESVSTHSFYVAICVLKLKEYYNFNLETALKTALIHDFPESFISDVPHNIKAKHPELTLALERAEDDITREKLSNEAADLISRFNDGSTPEGLVCQLSDILSVVLYAHDEIKVGNSKFNYIAMKAIMRCKDVITKLEPYLNGNYTTEEIMNNINQIVHIY